MKLAEYMDANELTQPELAKRLSVSQSAISQWLSGARFPKPEMLSRIRDLTDGAVTPNDFLPASDTEAA